MLFSQKSPLLWVVSYVNQVAGAKLFEEACSDIEESFENGAHSVVLINEWSSLPELENTLEKVRTKYPNASLGVNYLGDDSEPYGYKDSFRLAKEFDLKIVWTDFSGVDEIIEKPSVDLKLIKGAKPDSVFYCSGIHMKYSTLKDPLKTVEESAKQAMNWVDGIVMTGPKTGIKADPNKVKNVRQMIGQFPLGLASGVSAQNAYEFRDHVDFCLVASSMQDENKRIIGSKVKGLVEALRR